MIDTLKAFLDRTGIFYEESAAMSRLSSAKLGGKADVLLLPDCENKLISALQYLRENKIKYRIIGGMSNLLPTDSTYNGVLVSTRKIRGYTFDGRVLSVSCGENIGKIAMSLAGVGYGGLSELCGIPGTVGGAIVGNAGAYGKEIAELLLSVTLYDMDAGCVFTLAPGDLNFGYRSSILKGNCRFAVLSSTMRIFCGDPLAIYAEMREMRDRRSKSQPREPSLGSVFKRTERGSAGELIDRAGLKGVRIGGAEISAKHAGFIVNAGGATARDFLALADMAAERVFDFCGVRLEREIEIL